jgi:F0F1-type ATP synthase assembly protein I
VSSPPPKKAAWFRYTDAASIGIEIAVAITICSLGAMWLEANVTHWSPWTTLLGLLVGIVAAGKAVMRTARNHQAALAAETEANAKANANAKEHDGG